VARLLGVKGKEIVFTSGGTESINSALWGTAMAHRGRGRHIVTTAIEHPAVLETCRALQQQGFEVTFVAPDPNGVVPLRRIQEAVRDDTILVSVMHVNNETGAVQPVEALGQWLADKPKIVFHVDAVQSFGKMDIPLKGVDLISVSSHKIHGPKGVGALFVRAGLKWSPLLLGGGQEAGRRSGTEPVPAIAGFAAACRWWLRRRPEVRERIQILRDVFFRRLQEKLKGYRVNSPEGGAPYIVNLSFPGLKGEVLVHALEARGVYVSTASACSSRKQTYSHVLKAMGVPEEAAEGSLRFSFSPLNEVFEIEKAVDVLAQVVDELRLVMRR
ncbi:MAG: cysteine desulfurase, partial [Alicyclobacillaceae bacterium]|nr:cysteine desulfurase [Alicyclobacillaceae bacterium]